MPSHRLLLRAGYVRQLGSGHLFAPAARQARQRPGRADHPRGAGPDRRPGDGDAGRPPGRHLAGERSLRRDRAGAGPLQGSQRAGHGPRDDPRGGRRHPARRHRQVVPPAADAGLSLPDEVARRATRPRRPDPRPRVRHEGRLQLRPGRGRPGRQLRGAARRLQSGPSSASASTPSPSRRTSGSWAGRQAHEFMVLNPAGEDVLVLCEACGYAANRQVAIVPKPDPAPEEPLAARGGRDARHDDHRDARRVPRASARSARPRPPSS